MKTDFSGIHEKLKRADENIVNLETELSRFFQECKYPIMPKIGTEEHDEAVHYFKTLLIPLRFSVLSGEIVHHLRSCLDHVIWELSSDTIRISKKGTALEFPIFKSRPSTKDEVASYNGKIQGVTNTDALKRIEEFQPYHRSDPLIDPLYVIHVMDIADKHRELVITHSTGRFEGPLNLMREMSAHFANKTTASPDLLRQFNEYGKITPQVSFKDLRGWEKQAIVPALAQLYAHVGWMVEKFEVIGQSRHP